MITNWFRRKPVHLAEPVKSQAGEIREIAGITGGRDVTKGYIDDFAVLPVEDTVLRAKSAWGSLELYESIASDPDVKIAMEHRRLALVSKEWYVEPGEESRAGKKAAKLLQETLERIAWDAVTEKMLWGVFFGFAVAECMWSIDGNAVNLQAIKVKKPRRFVYSPNGELKLLTMADREGIKIPDRKFWTYRAGAIDDDNPYGIGLAHWLYWPVWFRKNGERFWSVYMEKYAMPTAVGKHPAGADKSQKDLLMSAVKAVHRDSSITLSDNMMIELLEATRSSGGDYSTFGEYWRKTIYRLIIGQSFTIDGSAGVVKGDNMMDVFGQIIKSDADLINHSFNSQVAAWLTEWNFPGTVPPKAWRRCEDDPDLLQQSEIHKNLFAIGYRPTLEEISEQYGGEWESVQQAQPTESPAVEPQKNDGTAEMAEPKDQPDSIDRFTRRLGAEAEPLVRAMLGRVKELLDESADLAEAEEKLAGLFPQMATRELADLLGEAFLAAELAGRYDLQNGE